MREAAITRKTAETDVSLRLSLPVSSRNKAIKANPCIKPGSNQLGQIR